MRKTAELVMVPAPGMGHLASSVKLGKRLIQTNPNISISIHIITQHVHSSKIKAYVEESQSSVDPTRLTFITHTPLPNPPEPSFNFMASIIDPHKPLIKQAVENRIRSGFPKPTGFILDMFCVNMIDIADDFNIPSYVFFTSGAGGLIFLYMVQSMADDQGIDVPTKFSEPGFSTAVPGFKNRVPSKLLPSTFQERGPFCDMLFGVARRLREVKGVLINTYEELETLCLKALLDDKTIPTVYPVGPLVELDGNYKGCSKEDQEARIIKWLDSQPEFSVVFLCFGSEGSFEEDQVKEIAKSLEQSGHRFIWCLQKPPLSQSKNVEEELFLEGFLERTGNRGMIIEWAPQAKVLAHPAVGGFVSHCGWNSTLESIWFEVPMAAFPRGGDQQLNAFLLVKELGLAVEIRMDYKILGWQHGKGNMIVTAAEIEDGIKKLMTKDDEMRNKVKEMSNIGRKALEEGGSSYKWLAKYIEDVFSNIP